MAALVIRSEADAWEAFGQRFATQDAIGDARITFKGWPRFDITIDPGDGMGTSEMMRAVQVLQRAVHCGYALVKYGVPNSRLLTKKDRYPLAVQWSVKKGSTIFGIDLSKAFTEIGRVAASKLNGPQVLAGALIICSAAVFATWLNNQGMIQAAKVHAQGQRELAEVHAAADVRKEEIRLQAQRELLSEVRAVADSGVAQMQMLKAAYERYEFVRYAATDFIPWRPALLDIAQYAGTIDINGIRLEAAVAKKVSTIAKRVAKIERQMAKDKPNAPLAISATWMVTVTKETDRPSPPMRLGRNVAT